MVGAADAEPLTIGACGHRERGADSRRGCFLARLEIPHANGWPRGTRQLRLRAGNDGNGVLPLGVRPSDEFPRTHVPHVNHAIGTCTGQFRAIRIEREAANLIVMPVEHVPHLRRHGVGPQVDVEVGVGTGQELAVRAVGNCVNLIGMAVEQNDGIGLRWSPNSGRSIPTGRDQEGTVRAPRESRDAIGVARQLSRLFVREGIPNSHGAIFASRGDELAARCKGDGRDALRMRFNFAQKPLCGRIPEANRAIVVAAGQGPTIVAEGDCRHPRGLLQASE